MIRVGLTGGIGAGKSTVSGTFSECGAIIVDGDVIEPTLQHEAGGVVFDRLQGLLAFHFAQRGLFCTDHISKPSKSLHRVQYCTA